MPNFIAYLNEGSLRAGFGELVRRSAEGASNGLLEEEINGLVCAERHGSTAEREAYRAGRCERKFVTASCEATIRMPKLEGVRFTTTAIERCRRWETSVEGAMAEICLAGVSTRSRT